MDALEESGDTGEGSSAAREIDEDIDAAAGLVPDLRSRVSLVCQDIGLKMKLISAKGCMLLSETLRTLLDQGKVLARDLVGHGARCLIDQHHLRAERLHHARPLGCVSTRHNGDEGVSQCAADDGQSCACISAGQLDDRLPRLKLAVSSCLTDHLQCDAVFFRPSRIQVLELDQEATIQSEPTPDLVQLNHGGASDDFSDGVG